MYILILAVLICLVMVLVVLCHVSNTCQYYVKFTFFTVSSLIFGTIFIPFMLFRPRDPRNALMPAWGCRMAAMVNGMYYEVRGHENIVPKGQGCVVLMNHQSALDLIVLSNLWPIMPGSCVIAKREVFWLWPFGLATWLWGTVFIDRLNPDQAQGTLNQTGTYINTHQARILMYPEGTRHLGDQLLPFKKGAFHLALAAQCSIQPVTVSRYHCLDNKNKRFETGHNIIEILPAIPTSGLTRNQLPELMEQTQRVMQESVTKLSIETMPRHHAYKKEKSFTKSNHPLIKN